MRKIAFIAISLLFMGGFTALAIAQPTHTTLRLIEHHTDKNCQGDRCQQMPQKDRQQKDQQQKEQHSKSPQQKDQQENYDDVDSVDTSTIGIGS